MLASCWALSTRSLRSLSCASASSRSATSRSAVSAPVSAVSPSPMGSASTLIGPRVPATPKSGRGRPSARDVRDDQCLGTSRRPTLSCCAASRPRRPLRRRPDRDLRLRVRRPHRGSLGHRPAAARVGALPRRHRPAALRPQADRRGARVRARVPRPPLRPGRQGARHRLQLRERGHAPRRAGAVRRPGGGGHLPGHPPCGRRQPDRPDRRDLHPGDRGVDGLRGRVRGRAAHRADDPGLPAVRRLRRGRRDRRRRAASRSPTSTSTR